VSAGGGGIVAEGEALAAATGGAISAAVEGVMPGGGGTTGTVPNGVGAKLETVALGIVLGRVVLGAVGAVAGTDAETEGVEPAAGGGEVCANKFRATVREARDVISSFFIC